MKEEDDLFCPVSVFKRLADFIQVARARSQVSTNNGVRFTTAVSMNVFITHRQKFKPNRTTQRNPVSV